MISLIFTSSETEVDQCAIGADLHDAPMVIEVTLLGLRVTPRERWAASHHIVYEFALKTEAEGELQLDAAIADLDHDDVTPWTICKCWLGAKRRHLFQSTVATLTCELVLQLDPDHLLSDWAGLDPKKVLPADLLLRCQTGKSWRVIYVDS